MPEHPPQQPADCSQQQPLQLAIVNQVDYHLHVVAGAMQVLQAVTSAPVHVFLTSKVLRGHLGFMSWLGSQPGFVFRDCQELLLGPSCSSSSTDGASTAFDLVWHISPEFDLPFMQQLVPRLRSPQHSRTGAAAGNKATPTPAPAPPLQLFYVHNGHMPDGDLQQLCELAGTAAGGTDAGAVPPPPLLLLGMSPHVAAYVQQRLDEKRQQQQSAAGVAAAAAALDAEWMLPTWPYYQPQASRADSCSTSSSQEQQQHTALDGFSITGSFDKSLRDYGRLWAAIAEHRDAYGPQVLQHFRLNLLGHVVADELHVPADLQQYVRVLTALPDADFYAAISSSIAIVPALANPAYLTCKLTSAAITTLMTGVPILADAAFLAAYSFLGAETVLQQQQGESELEAMFRVAAADPLLAVEPVRARLRALARAQNDRGVKLLRGWLQHRSG